MTNYDIPALLLEILDAEQDLNKAQALINKTHYPKCRFLKKRKQASLQLHLDVQRIRVEAAKEYLTAIAKIV